MAEHRPTPIPVRMFIDETFYLECPGCKMDHQFQLTAMLKRRCIACTKILLLTNFKYGSDRSYRNICNPCQQKKKDKGKPNHLTYSMMPCGTCLQEGKSIAEATIRVNSKGAWDIEGLHKHQEGIYKKESKNDPLEDH